MQVGTLIHTPTKSDSNHFNTDHGLQRERNGINALPEYQTHKKRK